jgi:hypothetical protein
MNGKNHLEMFLTLNAEAFKRGLDAAGASVKAMPAKMGAAFSETRARLQENISAVRTYNAELNKQSGIVQALTGRVTALIGAYLGFQTIAGVTVLLKNADSAAFSLEASLRAANREFSNIGSAQSWAATIDRMVAKLRIYSKSELKQATASTIDMTKRLGFSAAQMETLILRTADLSAGKTDLSGGIERVTAAMRGEAEASEYLGLTLNENYVKAWHEAHNATGKAWKDLTDLEKAQVRYNVFLEQANPLTGKAADSITTMAGAYALARSRIHDAVSENQNAVAATKQLATVIAEHADEIGELATLLINAATGTMQFVLNNKEAIAIIGGLTLGAGAAATAISWMTTIWQGLNTVMLAMTGSTIIPWLGSLATGIKTVNLAALSLKGVLGAVSGLFLAWQAGWQIGTWLNKFAVVQKAGVGLAYILDRTGLAAKKMWAILTGGDVAAVERQIAIAKDAYQKSIEEIERTAREKAEADKKPQPPPESSTQNKPKSDIDKLTEDNIKAAKATWKDEWLKPEEREARQKELEEKGEAAPEAEAARESADAQIAAAEEVAREKELLRQKDLEAQQNTSREEARLRHQRQQELLADLESDHDELESRRQENAEEAEQADQVRAEAKEQADEERRQRQRARNQAHAEEEEQQMQERAERLKDEDGQIQSELLDNNTADQRAETEENALTKILAGLRTYAEKVKAIQNDMAGRQRSLAEDLADLDPRSTPEQKWKRSLKAAKDYEKAAKAAMKAGDLEKALSLSDQAREAYSSLKNGDGSIFDKYAGDAAYKGVKSSGELGLLVSQMLQKATAKSALAAIPVDAGPLGNISANIRGQLAAVASGPDQSSQGGKSTPDKVHELRFAGASLQGGEDDIEKFLQGLEKAGLRAG